MQTPSKLGNSAIDVSLIRKELEKLFSGYHPGVSGDPIDVFLNLMTAVHSYHVNSNLSEDNSTICKPLCPAHACFALKIHEEILCLQCNKKTNNVYDNNYYVYEAYIWEIMNTIKSKPFKEFNKLLFNTINTVTSIFDNILVFCKCSKQLKVSKAIVLHENPPYLIIHLTWDSLCPPLVDLCNIYTMIPLFATNNALFKLTDKVRIATYELKCIITFYNGHYTSCFKSIKENKWYFCDDMIIKEFNTWFLLMQYMVKNHYHPIALFYDISKNEVPYEHINQKDYQELYSICSNQDRNKNENYKSPFNVAEKQESTNSFMLLNNKRRSGMFNRFSNTNGESSQNVVSDDNKFYCSNCNKHKPITLANCNDCGKLLTKQPSNTELDDHWKATSDLDNIKNVVSIKQADHDIPIKNMNKLDQLRGGYCAGIKEEVDFGNIRQSETNAAIFFDRNSSTEAEKGEEEHEIKKTTTKEILLNYEEAQKYVLGSSPKINKPKQPPQSQFKPKQNKNDAFGLIDYISIEDDKTDKIKQNMIKPLERERQEKSDTMPSKRK